MKTKRILLIEDCDEHANITVKLLEKLKDIYSVDYKVFVYLLQNGQNRSYKFDEIKNYISSQISYDNFDILMIDMLLGDDSAEDPLGLQIIKNLLEELKTKKIFVYTEMSSDELDLIKNYNRSIGNIMKIIAKPDLKVLSNKVDCIGEKRKKIIGDKDVGCTKKDVLMKKSFCVI